MGQMTVEQWYGTLLLRLVLPRDMRNCMCCPLNGTMQTEQTPMI